VEKTKKNPEKLTEMNGYRNGYIISREAKPQNRVCVGVPMTGVIRSEWMMARYGQVIPCNWSQVDIIQWIDQWSPMQFQVADARNIIASDAVKKDYEWLVFIDHDVCLPPLFLVQINEHMLKGNVPIFGGLYWTKSIPSEPLVYRGRGNSYYKDWKFGDKIWVDGLGMGATVIHVSILKALYKESEPYPGNFANRDYVRRIYAQPVRTWYDPQEKEFHTAVGTEDLEFLSRIMKDGIFKKAGWPEYEKKQFPYMVDTGIYCRHIDWEGIQYPTAGEDGAFIPKKKK